MRKRFMAVSLAALMLVSSMAGCKKAENGTASGNTIKIGGLAPLTGKVAVYGVATNNGIKLAVEEANANGGLLGKKIDYIVYDEKGDANEAVNAYNKLVQSDQVVALVGDVTTNPTLAVAQQAIKDGLPMITATATAAEVTTTGENIFRTCFIDPFQGELMASYASKKLNAKTAAIIFDTADDYSSGVATAFEKAAESLGMKVVSKEGYTGGDVDFKSQLTKIASQKPDVLLAPVYHQDIALIAVQAKEIGLKSTLLGGDGWDGVLDKIDKSNVDAVKGAYFCSQYSAESDDPKLKAFLKKYKETYNTDANQFAVLGYDAMSMMIESIKQANSTKSEDIVAKMKALDFNGLTGHMTFDANRNPIKKTAITTIEDGKYKFVEYYEK